MVLSITPRQTQSAAERRQVKGIYKQLDLERRRKELDALRATARRIEARRSAAINRSKALCRAARQRLQLQLAAHRKREAERIEKEAEAMRSAARNKCEARLRRIQSSALGTQERAKREQAELLAQAAAIKAADRAARLEAKRQKIHARQDSDREVLRLLPDGLRPVFRRVKDRIRRSGELSRAEAFLLWAEGHPEEVLAVLYPEDTRTAARSRVRHEKAELEFESKQHESLRRAGYSSKQARALTDKKPIARRSKATSAGTRPPRLRAQSEDTLLPHEPLTSIKKSEQPAPSSPRAPASSSRSAAKHDLEPRPRKKRETDALLTELERTLGRIPGSGSGFPPTRELLSEWRDHGHDLIARLKALGYDRTRLAAFSDALDKAWRRTRERVDRDEAGQKTASNELYDQTRELINRWAEGHASFSAPDKAQLEADIRAAFARLRAVDKPRADSELAQFLKEKRRIEGLPRREEHRRLRRAKFQEKHVEAALAQLDAGIDTLPSAKWRHRYAGLNKALARLEDILRPGKARNWRSLADEHRYQALIERYRSLGARRKHYDLERQSSEVALTTKRPSKPRRTRATKPKSASAKVTEPKKTPVPTKVSAEREVAELRAFMARTAEPQSESPSEARLPTGADASEAVVEAEPVSLVKNPYEERREARAARLRAGASKARQAAAATIAASQRMASHIPLGQPILVGHHSEKRHRRDLERIHSGYQKGHNLETKAQRLDAKASRLESSDVISSDDPEAIRKLDERITALKAEREQLRERFRRVKGARRSEGYLLTNISSNIRRLEGRREMLATHKPKPETAVGSIRIVEEDNRVKLFFPSKPSEEIRTLLKRSGFRWSPTNGAWQSRVSYYAWQHARQIAEQASADQAPLVG